MKSWAAWCLALMVYVGAHAQADMARTPIAHSYNAMLAPTGIARDTTKPFRPGFHIGTRLRIGYLGSIIYPGATAGLEFPIREVEIHKFGKRREKLVFREHYLSGDLSLYDHPGFHTNLYLTFSYNFRRIAPHGFFAGYAIGPGISRTFFGGTTYRVNDAGQVQAQSVGGHFYFALVASAILGKDFRNTKLELPIALSLKPSVLLLMPYAGRIYWRPTLDLGISFDLDRLMPHFLPLIEKTHKK